MFIQLKNEHYFKKGRKRCFSYKPNMNIIYPNEENAFMMAKHEKKGDYYVKPCLSKSTNERSF